jgi:hypothetical protein
MPRRRRLVAVSAPQCSLRNTTPTPPTPRHRAAAAAAAPQLPVAVGVAAAAAAAAGGVAPRLQALQRPFPPSRSPSSSSSSSRAWCVVCGVWWVCGECVHVDGWVGGWVGVQSMSSRLQSSRLMSSRLSFSRLKSSRLSFSRLKSSRLSFSRLYGVRSKRVVRICTSMQGGWVDARQAQMHGDGGTCRMDMHKPLSSSDTGTRRHWRVAHGALDDTATTLRRHCVLLHGARVRRVYDR